MKKDRGSLLQLELDKIGWTVETKRILNEVTLKIHPGEMIGLLGPNGSGKSSLLRCIYRYLKPTTGVIYLNGVDIERIPFRESAQTTAAVLQERRPEFHVKVFEVVLMGRSPYKKLFDGDSRKDYELAMTALKDVNMEDFADRFLHTLSGGEVQRVYLARALCQQANLLILDEPTNHLDISYQLEIMELVKQLSLSTICALHDLNIAAAYCDRVFILHEGNIILSGCPEDVLSKELIEKIYGVNAMVIIQPETGKLNISYLSLSRVRQS